MRTPKRDHMTAGLKKGAWSLEEDRMLIDYINRYGIWNWSYMPKFAGLLRSGKSCRLRWMNYLKPDLKKGSFTEDEERSILHFHSILGNRWSTIARKLPGRSDNEIKNYWHTSLKKRLTNIPVPKKSKKKGMSVSTCLDSHNAKKIPEDVINHANNDDDDITNFLFSWISEGNNSFSSTSTTPTPKAHKMDYVGDIGSPGTIEDLQCFWRELYPLDDQLEVENINEEMHLDYIFQDSYDDLIAPWSFYSNE